MLNLYEYLDLSKRVIRKHGNKGMLNSEDAIAHIAHFLMLADKTYKEGIGTLPGYRWSYGKLGVVDWITKEKKRKKVSNIDSSQDFDFINNIPCNENVLDNIKLNEICSFIDKMEYKRQICIKLYYYENKTLEEISQILHLTKQRIQQIIQSAIKEIRGKYGMV